jgi:hypothetical protein
MPTPSRGWRFTYVASWLVALGLPGTLLLPLAAHTLGLIADVWPVLGGLAGAVLGVIIARGTGERPALHRTLRVGAPLLVAASIVAALFLFRAAEAGRVDGVMFSGFGEYLLALLSLLVAAVGVALWLAGLSGPRAAGLART